MFLKQRAPLPNAKANLLAMAVTAFLYVATAQLGLLIAMKDCTVTALWPPAGIALASLMLFGRKLWPSVWGGAFIANLLPLITKNSPVGLGGAVLAASVIACSVTSVAWLAAWAIAKRARVNNTRSGVRGVAFFMLFGGVVSCCIGAAISSFIFCKVNPEVWPQWSKIWLTWWLGDALGVFLFTPLILAWSEKFPELRREKVIEASACFAVLVLFTWVVFDTTDSFFGYGGMHDYIVLPVIVWAALRLGYRGATTALVIVSVIGMASTMAGSGPFVQPTLNDSVFFLGLYLCCLVATGLFLSAAVDERTAAQLALSESNANLESHVKARTEELRQTTGQLYATIESSAYGLLVVDADNKVTLFNQRFAQMWKIPPHLLQRKNDKALLAFVMEQLESPDTFIKGIEALYSKPEAESFDTLYFKDGRIFDRYSQPQKIEGKIVGRIWDFVT